MLTSHPAFISIFLFIFGFSLTLGAVNVFAKDKHGDSLMGKVLGAAATPTPAPTNTPTPSPTNTPTPTQTPTPTPKPTSTPTPTPIPPTPTPTSIPTPTSVPAVLSVSDDIWEKLAACESGGNWSIDTGNGYFGGLQFSQGAWESVGGSGKPSDASRDEQISRGKALQAARGWGVWGECAVKLGLN